VRANLTAIPFGKASVPIGPGVVYGSLRSLAEAPLRGQNWALGYAEEEGRSQWILERVDERRSSLTMTTAEKAVKNYLKSIPTTAGTDPLADLEQEITAAKTNQDEANRLGLS
jgi:hypothetical protein